MSVDGNSSNLDSGLQWSRVTVGLAVELPISLGVHSEITSIDIGFLSVSRSELGLDELLMDLQYRLKLGDWYVVEEDTFAEGGIRYCEPLLAVSGLPGIVSTVQR
jgi:hypothetical protein